MSEAEPPPAPEGFFGRTFSKVRKNVAEILLVALLQVDALVPCSGITVSQFSGAKKSTDSGLARSGTMQRTGTMSRGAV